MIFGLCQYSLDTHDSILQICLWPTFFSLKRITDLFEKKGLQITSDNVITYVSNAFPLGGPVFFFLFGVARIGASTSLLHYTSCGSENTGDQDNVSKY